MLNLRAVTFASLLLLVVAVGCSSSDQAAIDKAVSPTLAADQLATAAATATAETAKENSASSIESVGIDRDESGWTPLRSAVKFKAFDVARLLIEHGANTDGIDLSWMDD